MVPRRGLDLSLLKCPDNRELTINRYPSVCQVLVPDFTLCNQGLVETERFVSGFGVIYMQVLTNELSADVLKLGQEGEALTVTNMGCGIVVVEQTNPTTRKPERVVLTKTDLAAMMIWLS